MTSERPFGVPDDRDDAMQRPDATFTTITLHLSTKTRFRRRFGDKVTAAGGTWSNTYGDAVTRYVTLPVSEAELLDRIALSDRKLEGATHVVLGGFVDPRFDKEVRARDRMMSWTPEMDRSVSAFARREFERRLETGFDWNAMAERWHREDAETARRDTFEDMVAERELLRDTILGEAIRIYQGANDIETLKRLAGRYRELSLALGLPVPEGVPLAD